MWVITRELAEKDRLPLDKGLNVWYNCGVVEGLDNGLASQRLRAEERSPNSRTEAGPPLSRRAKVKRRKGNEERKTK